MNFNGNNWPPEAPDPNVYGYRMWTSETDEDLAIRRFQDRYGQPPEWVIDHAGFLWVGPVPATRGQS